jgi:ribosomal protein S18 acetylase RimI-like enzyme
MSSGMVLGADVSEIRMRVVPAGGQRDAYLPLLLLADDSESEVRSYYQNGDLYALDDADGPVAVTLAFATPGGTLELKAVAVDASRHNRGFGRRTLAAVLSDLKARGVTRVIVGTASCGVGQLAFYQKAGFRLRSIERDYFTQARGYPEGVQENGISVRDMVWMDQHL